MPDIDIKTHELERAYYDLSPHEKVTVQICAVIADPVAPVAILQCFACFLTTSSFLPTPTEPYNVEAILQKLKRLHLLNDKHQCNDLIAEIACRESVLAGTFPDIAACVRQLLPASELEADSNTPKTYHTFLRALRIAVYSRDTDLFNSALLAYFMHSRSSKRPNPIVQICNNPFDGEWFSTLPIQIQVYGLNEIYKHSLLHLTPIRPILDFFEKQADYKNVPNEAKRSLAYLQIVQLILTGNISGATQCAERFQEYISSLGLSGFLHFLRNDNEEAIFSFEQDLKTLRQSNGDENSYFTGIEGLIFIVALLKTGVFSHLEIIKKILRSIEVVQPHNIFRQAYISLRFVVDALENRVQIRSFHNHLGRIGQENCITLLFSAIAGFWIEGKIPSRLMPSLQDMLDKSYAGGYNWLALEFARLLERVKSEEKLADFIETLHKKTGSIDLLSAVSFEEPWQRALKALLHSTSTGDDVDMQASKTRLAWYVQFTEGTDDCLLIPKEQKYSGKGKWTKGRTVSLKKLFAGETPDFCSRQDARVCAGLHSKENPWGISYYFDPDTSLPALIGHPHIFLEGDPIQQVEFVRGEPELRVDQKDGKLRLRFFPDFSERRAILVKESSSRYKVYEFSDEHRRVAYILGERGLNVPVEAKDEVMAVLGNVSSFMTVHSAINGTADIIKTVDADPHIYIQLHPAGNGIRLNMFVKPFGIDGPYLKPGSGAENVMAEISGQRLQTSRDLLTELAAINHIVDVCPGLAMAEELDREWIISDPEQCLEVLYDLQRLGNEITIEWPEGQKFTVSRQITTDQFHIHIHKKNDWFQVEGSLALDNNLVLDMRRLIELTRTTGSRFVPIGEGQFLALTEELRKRIDDIILFSDQRGKNIRLSPVAAFALEDIQESGIHLKTDREWREHIDRIKAAQDFQPMVPSTLKADLRDYQLEGFKWLSRMAQWGVGACLADDMGLGKTIQALTIILDRARHGPTLVVAPTSVCMNWLVEANRFAPTLKVKLFTGKQRRKMVDNLKEFDLLIVSYALLQQEAELLTPIEWQTIVLDEAQAIKNMATKRSKAAMMLNGRFKVITTGTPIENHLGELWNLFTFINPGLLGSYRHFAKRFLIPIERHQDTVIRKKLRKLIKPFILRRIKSQVLEELPPRTEITLQVEMDPKEAALYEALRQQAIEKIGKSEGPVSKKHFTILAEITRLRRACCNPRLVIPGTTIKSSKLELFGQIIEELLDNRHKALVFSQFVDHLNILKEYLDKQKISYRYIDGSTSTKQRHREVERFQAGEGELFLISLKAGGLGLNLTAADYVIHMDPWWNPAVEDQASDRAHRIGQQHPVTVYRLVTRNSIEEKIINLHQDKRELADTLLKGTDITDRITAEELLALIQER